MEAAEVEPAAGLIPREAVTNTTPSIAFTYLWVSQVFWIGEYY